MGMKSDELANFLDEIIGGNAEQIGIRNWLDTGIPELNVALSDDIDKGVPGGRLIEIYGPESSGKTFLATMIMISAQKSGGVAGFSDHERSFETKLAEKLGLSLERHKFAYVRPQTFEESIDIAINFCEKIREQEAIDPKAPLVWVFDSVASMVPHDKLFDDKGNRRPLGSYNMRDSLALAKSCSQMLPVLAQFAEDNNMTVILLNQEREKPGVMFGNPITTPGGRAVRFYSSTRLAIGKRELTNGKKGDEKEVIGFECGVTAVKNKAARYGRKARWKVIYSDNGGVEVDVLATNLDYLIRQGIIEKSGNRVVWEGSKQYEKTLLETLRKDPDANNKLLEILRNSKLTVEEASEEELPVEE